MVFWYPVISLASPRKEKHVMPNWSVKLTAFCGNCGSSLYAEKPKRGMLHLRIGTLDEAPSLRPQFHSFVASKAEWDTICDGLPQYGAGRS